MASTLPGQDTCCDPCDSPLSVAVPGPDGSNGADGAAGAAGVSAFTYCANYFPAAQPAMPAEGGTVTVDVTSSTDFLTANAFVYVSFWGYMKVFDVLVGLSVTLLNPKVTATSEYAENAAPGTLLTAGSKIILAGIQGPSGAVVPNTAPADATYITQTPNGTLTSEQSLSGLATGVMKVTTATGVITSIPLGIADTNVAPVNDAGGMTNGEAVFATASGIESKTAATARTALGLGTIATQAASAVAVTGGTIDGTQVGPTTPASAKVTTLVATSDTRLQGNLYTESLAIQSLLAATAILAAPCKVRVAGNGGPVTLTATPTISNTPTIDGGHLFLMGTDNTNIVTLQDESSLAGTKLELAAATRALGKGDILHLMWDLTDAKWYEVSFSNN